MTVTASALRQLHRIHRQLSDVQERLDRGPKLLDAGKTNVQRLDDEATTVRDKLKKMKMSTDEKNLLLAEREGNVADLKRKLNSCSSNREYQALMERITADDQASSVLSDEILEAFDRIEEVEKRVKDSEAVHQNAVEEFRNLQVRVLEEKGLLETDKARLQAELKGAESELPDDFRVEYERMARVRGEDAMACIDGESCGGCYQMITSQMLNELYLCKPVFCKSCGRLLYLPEEHQLQ